MTGRNERITAVAERELRTVGRTRIYASLAVGFALILLAVTVASGASGYVPLLLTLLTPVELLVPVLAVAVGYRSILADRERGEIDILRTYPVSRGEYVSGVYLGRLAAIVVMIVVPLLLVSLAVPFTGGAPTFLPQPTGLDSPVLYLRFVALTAVFGAVTLAVMTLLSSAVDTNRRGLVLAVIVVLLFTVVVDAVTIAGLATGLSGEWSQLTILSPNGAYRGLVMALVVAPVTSVDTGSITLSALSLTGWFSLSLAAAAARVWVPAK